MIAARCWRGHEAGSGAAAALTGRQVIIERGFWVKITRLDRLARLGYGARAVVYALLGFLALTTGSVGGKGPAAQFELLGGIAGGRFILLALAIGLMSYGLYKLVGAVLDVDGNGFGFKGAVARGALLVGGAGYLALCWTALRLAAGLGASGQAGREAAATALALPLGGVALAIAGAGFLLAAGVQLRSAWTKRFMRVLESGAPPFTCTAGRVGLAARSVVFTVIGWSLLRGAWQQSAGRIRDLGGALAALRENEMLYLAVAAGLIVFAAYSALEARYRIVPKVDPIAAGKRAVSRRSAATRP
jgi:hypothetical protein